MNDDELKAYAPQGQADAWTLAFALWDVFEVLEGGHATPEELRGHDDAQNVLAKADVLLGKLAAAVVCLRTRKGGQEDA